MEYQLFSAKGSGSAIVEAALTLAGAPHRLIDTPPWDEGPHLETLRAVNPLLEVPTLILPDGRVMTESAAIMLYFAEHHPEARLAPPPDDPTRPGFLRWLVFLVASVYPTFTFGDHPSRWVSSKEAQDEVRKSSDEYRQKLWCVVEPACSSPWFLGDRFSALDLYIGAMVHWRPRRQWFIETCPKLAAAAGGTLARPDLKAVWQRHFQ